MEPSNELPKSQKQSCELLHRDTEHLGKIFPNEIWEMVTQKTNQCENFSRSSQFFRRILAPQRTLFLSNSVLGILISTVSNTGYLTFNDILNMRRVCKLWNASIDQLIAEICDKVEESNNITKLIQSNIKYHFFYDDGDASQNNLFKFLDNFKQTHQGELKTDRSPFIHAKLAVDTPDFDYYFDDVEPDLQHFLNGVSTLLERYGIHVTDFTLEIEKPKIDMQLAAKLQKWMTLMPNLKRLTINDPTEYFDIELSEIQEFFLTSSLPSFEKLEYLDIRHLNAPIFDHLIQQNNHLSCLHVKEGEEEYESYDIFSFPLPNMKALKFKLSPDTFDIIDKLSSPDVNWPLTSLSLSFAKAYDFLGWPELFLVIQQKFGKTLETFSFEHTVGCSERGGIAYRNFEDDFQLDLPNLTEVHYCMPISLDFLLPMRDNMKVISIRARYQLRKYLENVKKSFVQFHGFESGNSILDSNIWTIFKILEKIGIRLGSKEITWYYRKKLGKK